MKFLIYTLFILGFMSLTSCATTGTKKSSEEYQQSKSLSHYADLADYIRTVGNVQLKGTVNDLRLQIRGVNSMTADTRPFIYVDNFPFGRDFNKLNTTIDVQKVKSVKIISSLSQLAVYGAEGHSGIIKIRTIKTDKESNS